MQRRNFFKSGIALASSFAFLPMNLSNLLHTIRADNTVTFAIGEIKCTVFHDLQFKYLAKDFFINASPQELEQALSTYQITPDNIPSPFIALLLEQGDKKILIDTGVGFTKNPVNVRGKMVSFNGQLQALLQQEHIINESITDVIVTHFHPDHIGGIFSEDGQLNFPKARFHMHEDEWNFWHSSQSDSQPDQFKYFIEKNITRLKEGNLSLINGDFTDILPGIIAVKADGHTPGQIALIIHSAKQHLLYISDAFLHPLHIEKLNWQTNYDLDHEKAKQSRIKLLELARKDHMLINAFHFDFPGLGQVEKQANTWKWQYTKK
jgi:glyoxylase-like metal-dependent hydrolase (beta-lactamase superfamily II)